jgi:hypothetical protein
VDLSALIFVALAVAWAVYLVPKALKHHDDVVRSRSVDRFSDTMRVLARREPVNRRNARLVVTPGRPASSAVVVTKGGEAAPVEARARRAAAKRAARRRRRVLGLILLANAVVAALAAFHVVDWVWTAAPGVLLVGWLVACRLMVRRELAALAPAETPVRTHAAETHAAETPGRTPAAGTAAAGTPDAGTMAAGTVTAGTAPPAGPAEPVAAGPAEGPELVDDPEDTSSIAAVVDPTLWDPVPVTLPTYVTKPAARRRTVRTIDLDATGVWTSGNTVGDSQIAREAKQADKAARSRQAADDQRAVGS